MDYQQQVDINLFRPSTPQLVHDVRIVKIILLLWALVSFLLPTLIWVWGWSDPQGLGESALTRTRLFGFPLHYWLLAQGCTFAYLLLCKIYCLLWDLKRPKEERMS